PVQSVIGIVDDLFLTSVGAPGSITIHAHEVAECIVAVQRHDLVRPARRRVEISVTLQNLLKTIARIVLIAGDLSVGVRQREALADCVKARTRCEGGTSMGGRGCSSPR